MLKLLITAYITLMNYMMFLIIKSLKVIDINQLSKQCLLTIPNDVI